MDLLHENHAGGGLIAGQRPFDIFRRRQLMPKFIKLFLYLALNLGYLCLGFELTVYLSLSISAGSGASLLRDLMDVSKAPGLTDAIECIFGAVAIYPNYGRLWNTFEKLPFIHSCLKKMKMLFYKALLDLLGVQANQAAVADTARLFEGGSCHWMIALYATPGLINTFYARFEYPGGGATTPRNLLGCWSSRGRAEGEGAWNTRQFLWCLMLLCSAFYDRRQRLPSKCRINWDVLFRLQADFILGMIIFGFVYWMGLISSGYILSIFAIILATAAENLEWSWRRMLGFTEDETLGRIRERYISSFWLHKMFFYAALCGMILMYFQASVEVLQNLQTVQDVEDGPLRDVEGLVSQGQIRIYTALVTFLIVNFVRTGIIWNFLNPPAVNVPYQRQLLKRAHAS